MSFRRVQWYFLFLFSLHVSVNIILSNLALCAFCRKLTLPGNVVTVDCRYEGVLHEVIGLTKLLADIC